MLTRLFVWIAILFSPSLWAEESSYSWIEVHACRDVRSDESVRCQNDLLEITLPDSRRIQIRAMQSDSLQDLSLGVNHHHYIGDSFRALEFSIDGEAVRLTTIEHVNLPVGQVPKEGLIPFSKSAPSVQARLIGNNPGTMRIVFSGVPIEVRYSVFPGHTLGVPGDGWAPRSQAPRITNMRLGGVEIEFFAASELKSSLVAKRVSKILVK